MKRGTAIPITVALGGIVSAFVAWNSYNTVTLSEYGNQTAAIIEWQKSTDKNLEESQKEANEKFAKLTETVTEIRIDVATSKELNKLMSPRFEINPDAVEKRITKNLASSTNE